MFFFLIYLSLCYLYDGIDSYLCKRSLPLHTQIRAEKNHVPDIILASKAILTLNTYS